MSKHKKKKRNSVKKKKKAVLFWKKRRLLIISSFVLMLGVVGLVLLKGNRPGEKSQSEPIQHMKIPRRIQDIRDPWIREAYVFAYTNPDSVAYIPCFCGCDRLGHGSLKDCYLVPGIFGGYSITSHAEHCNICLNLAHTTKDLLAQGFNLVEVRRRIDFEFARYGQATPTPYPREGKLK